MSTTSQALSNLRAYVILIVLGFHSVLAYLDSSPATQPQFDAPPYRWLSFPIIDSQRWFGFDLFCAWHDVYLMSLMFFLSGLFVWPSLARKGSGTFLADRLLRLGLPLVLAVYLLMPVAHYPVYAAAAAEPSVAEFWRQWMALPFWPCGPQWFLWQLLLLNLLAAGLYRLAPQAGETFAQIGTWATAHPVRFALAFIAASAVAYVPLATVFSPWTWSQIGPFAFQHCRPLHYTVYFAAGLALGAHGLDRGLVAADGILAQRWPAMLAAAIVGFLAWIVPMAFIWQAGGRAPFALTLAANVGFVLGCMGGGAFVLALVLRFGRGRSRMLDSLSANAYGMYLIHYVFVVWLQYAQLGANSPAIVKAAVVFTGTVLASWSLTAALRAMPLGSRLIGTHRVGAAPKPSEQLSAR
jgi:glucan biosynthesis protein C